MCVARTFVVLNAAPMPRGGSSIVHRQTTRRPFVNGSGLHRICAVTGHETKAPGSISDPKQSAACRRELGGPAATSQATPLLTAD